MAHCKKSIDANNTHGSYLWKWHDPNKRNVPNSSHVAFDSALKSSIAASVSCLEESSSFIFQVTDPSKIQRQRGDQWRSKKILQIDCWTLHTRRALIVPREDHFRTRRNQGAMGVGKKFLWRANIHEFVNWQRNKGYCSQELLQDIRNCEPKPHRQISDALRQ